MLSGIEHILWQAFNWPSGALAGNLLASVVWATLFEWRMKAHRKIIHRHLDTQTEHLKKHVEDKLNG